MLYRESKIQKAEWYLIQKVEGCSDDNKASNKFTGTPDLSMYVADNTERIIDFMTVIQVQVSICTKYYNRTYRDPD